MYPVVRMLKELFVSRNDPPLEPLGTHISHHTCWPWDIDMWLELNNGRSLTLYDLGRIPLAVRVGLAGALRRNRWSMTMAGVSVRWRARIRTFERFSTRSRCVGWDDKFIYLDQTMWKRDGTCASQALYRTAVVDKNGIVSPQRVMQDIGIQMDPPKLPAWVQAWIDADATRIWPPEVTD